MTLTKTRSAAGEGAGSARLDNLTLARKEGWQRFVNSPARIPPEPLTRAELDALGEEAVEDYNRRRREWHANLGPIKTPQLAALHEDLWDIVDSNAQDGDKAKGAVAIDAFPGLGKTTSVLAFARQYHRREINALGDITESGDERWPVCRVGLTGNTGMKEFNRAMLEFFAHPGSRRGTAADYARRVLDCVLSCDVRVLIIDDLHFLQWRNSSGIAISNHFKYIANEFPVTMIFIGVGLAARGLFSEGSDYQDAVLAQTGRRTTALGMEPFAGEHRTRPAALAPASAGHRTARRAGRQARRHDRRRPLRLPLRAVHRPHRVADDADQPGMSTRCAQRRRETDHRTPRQGQDRRRIRKGPPRTRTGDQHRKDESPPQSRITRHTTGGRGHGHSSSNPADAHTTHRD